MFNRRQRSRNVVYADKSHIRPPDCLIGFTGQGSFIANLLQGQAPQFACHAIRGQRGMKITRYPSVAQVPYEWHFDHYPPIQFYPPAIFFRQARVFLRGDANAWCQCECLWLFGDCHASSPLLSRVRTLLSHSFCHSLCQTEEAKRPAQIVQGCVKMTAFMDPIRPTHVSRRTPYDR